MTVGEALRAAAASLEGLSESPRLDAEVLLGHVLGWSRALLLAASNDLISPGQESRWKILLDRRREGEPVAYLTGVQEFWSLPLRVTPAVLIPRPDTELLVEWGLEILQVQAISAPVIADLGTGSGAIALALASERPDAEVWATELSSAALAVARANADQLGLPVRFSPGRWLQPLFGHSFNLIVSNPPYIEELDTHLHALRYEPREALTAGADGLRDLREIIVEAPAHLARNGWLLLEHGAGQAAAVRELLQRAGFERVETRCDLAGHERASGGQRP
jgi:release factor glutamine methyltransferase